MKKVISILICLQIFLLPALASNSIEDNFVEHTLKDSAGKISKKNIQPIEDELVLSTLGGKSFNQKQPYQTITDNLVKKELSAKKYIFNKQNAQIINDEIVIDKNKPLTQSKGKKTKKFDFEALDQIPIKLSISDEVNTKKELLEGQKLTFKVVEDVQIDKSTTIKKGSIVSSKLGTVCLNQAFGTPADVIIEEFKINYETREIPLEGRIQKTGANRALWVYPVGYTTGVMFLGLGFLLFCVRGGHAKLKPSEVYTVYYIPKK